MDPLDSLLSYLLLNFNFMVECALLIKQDLFALKFEFSSGCHKQWQRINPRVGLLSSIYLLKVFLFINSEYPN